MQMRHGASENTKFTIIKYLLLNDSAYYMRSDEQSKKERKSDELWMNMSLC